MEIFGAALSGYILDCIRFCSVHTTAQTWRRCHLPSFLLVYSHMQALTLTRNLMVQDGSELGTRPLLSEFSYIHVRIILRVEKPTYLYCTASVHFYACVYGVHYKLLSF